MVGLVHKNEAKHRRHDLLDAGEQEQLVRAHRQHDKDGERPDEKEEEQKQVPVFVPLFVVRGIPNVEVHPDDELEVPKHARELLEDLVKGGRRDGVGPIGVYLTEDGAYSHDDRAAEQQEGRVVQYTFTWTFRFWYTEWSFHRLRHRMGTVNPRMTTWKICVG